MSFWFAESFSFSASVKTTGIDHIAVLADSNQENFVCMSSGRNMLQSSKMMGGAMNQHGASCGEYALLGLTRRRHTGLVLMVGVVIRTLYHCEVEYLYYIINEF